MPGGRADPAPATSRERRDGRWSGSATCCPDAARGLGLEDELRLSRAMATFERLVAERVPAAAGACRVDPDRRLRDRRRGRRADRRPGAAAPRRRAAGGVRRDAGRVRGARAAGSSLRPVADGAATDRCAGRRPARLTERRPETRRVYCPDLPANLGARVPNASGPASAFRAVLADLGAHSHERPDLAVRLQMKLGVVAEPDRSPSSPDTVVVVEPTIGCDRPLEGPPLPARDLDGSRRRRAQEATRLAAETIRERVLLRRVGRDPGLPREGDRVANKRLAHQRERLGLHGTADNGPIGIGDRRRPRQRAVRRDDRAGRGLPDPPGPPVDPARPAPRARPADRRSRAGRLARRDLGRRLARPRLAERRSAGSAPDELKDAMVTLHPAVGDGAPPPPLRRGRRHAAATARSPSRRPRSPSTHRSRTLVPVRPAEPLAGRAGPLADPARRQRRPAGVAAVQASATPRPERRRRRLSAGSSARLQDLLPHRRPSVPAGDARGGQARDPAPGGDGDPRLRRRDVGGLGLGASTPSAAGVAGTRRIESLDAARPGARQGQRRPRPGHRRPGSTSSRTTRRKAIELLTEGVRQLRSTSAKRHDPRRRPSIRSGPRSSPGSTGCTTWSRSRPRRSCSSATGQDAARPRGDDRRARQGVPYVLDRATQSVYRIDLKTKKATVVFRAKTKAARHGRGRPAADHDRRPATC